jgi:hypothetical protein
MRLVVYDRTCIRERGRLSPIWAAGVGLYRRLGRIDDSLGVASWDEALDWLATQRDPIHEIQYWGHGKWGRALVEHHAFDRYSITLQADKLAAIRERPVPDALVWFRTCETFGANAGLDFAQALSDTLGVRVAGHTYVIGFHQSGLHGLLPGNRPSWSPSEGLREGTPEAPVRAKPSRPWAPNTITLWSGRIPDRWF